MTTKSDVTSGPAISGAEQGVARQADGLTADDKALIAHLSIEANKRIAFYVADYIAAIRQQHAAAPEMFEALKATKFYVETLEKVLRDDTDPAAPKIRAHAEMIRAALSKAKGGQP